MFLIYQHSQPRENKRIGGILGIRKTIVVCELQQQKMQIYSNKSII